MQESNDAVPAGGASDPAAGSELAEGKDAFIAALRKFRKECGSPSGQKLAATSGHLRLLYPGPGGTDRKLPLLSETAISEILAGKRRRLPSAEWVASFVLSCQRRGADTGSLITDPGTSTLPHWQERLRQAHVTQDVPAPPADDPIRLPPQHQAFVASHGPYGDELLACVEDGRPESIYQVAVLLGCDPGRAEDACALLVRAASSRYQPAADLLDDNPSGCLPPAAAARCAYHLAQAAESRGAAGEAQAFYQAAARGGVHVAAVRHAAAMLEKRGEPQAAAWLAPLASPPRSDHGTGPARPG